MSTKLNEILLSLIELAPIRVSYEYTVTILPVTI